MFAKEKLQNVIFYLISLFLFLWLSFFIEPVNTRFGNYIVIFIFLFLVTIALFDIKKFATTFLDKKDLFLWVYLLILTESLFFAKYHEIAISRYIGYVVPIPIIYYFFKIKGNLFASGKFITCIVCIFADIVSILAILEIIFHKNIVYEYFVRNTWYTIYLFQNRAMSTQLVPAVLGTYLLACMPFSYYLFYNGKDYISKYLAILSAILCSIGIITSFSRGAMLGLIGLTSVYFYKKNKIIIAIMLIIVSSIVLFSSLSGKQLFYKFSKTELLTHYIYSKKINKVFTTLNILKSHPFIGVGLDHFRIVYNDYSVKEQRCELLRVPDNMHLMFLGESGILGYLSFILFIFPILFLGYKTNNEISLALTASIVGIIFNMFTYDLLYWTVPFYLFWIYCGILSAIINKANYV